MAGVDEDLRALTLSDGRNLQYARLLFEAFWSRPSKPDRCFTKEHEMLYQHWLRLARVIIRNNGGVTPFGPLDCECGNIRVRRLTPPEAVFQPWPPEPVVAVFQPQSESQ